MKRLALTYLVILTTYGVLDFAWLGLISQASYQASIGHLMRDDIPVWPWVVFYLIYVAAILKLVVMPSQTAHQTQSFVRVMINGSVFGLAAYGAYNLTNYTILATWPLHITLIDWLWGTAVSGVISVSGALCWQKLAHS